MILVDGHRKVSSLLSLGVHENRSDSKHYQSSSVELPRTMPLVLDTHWRPKWKISKWVERIWLSSMIVQLTMRNRHLIITSLWLLPSIEIISISMRSIQVCSDTANIPRYDFRCLALKAVAKSAQQMKATVHLPRIGVGSKGLRVVLSIESRWSPSTRLQLVRNRKVDQKVSLLTWYSHLHLLFQTQWSFDQQETTSWTVGRKGQAYW